MAVIPVTGLGGTATDNRLAVQAAIDAAAPGDVLLFPAGDWTFNNVPGSATYAMRIAKPLTLRGAGLVYDGVHQVPGRTIPRVVGGLTTLRMDAAEALSEGTFWLFLAIDTTDLVVEDMEFHGQKPNSGQLTKYGPFQDPPLYREHGTGFFVNNVQRVTFRRCYLHDFIGDAIQNYNDVADLLVEDCAVRWCQRDGITLSPTDLFRPVRRVVIRRTEISECSNQQIDNEHGAAHDGQIYQCVLNGGDGDYSIALGGPDIDTEIYPDPIPLQTSNWRVHHNVINGSCYSAWLHNSVYEHNVGVNAGGGPLYEIGRACTNVRVRSNRQSCSQMVLQNQSAVYAYGTGGSAPSDILVERNEFTMMYERTFGVRADGCISISIINNDLIGAGLAAAGFAGIKLRATAIDRPFESAIVLNNKVRNFGQFGIEVQGNGVGPVLEYLEVTKNVLFNDVGAAMTVALDLNDDSGTTPVVTMLVRDNRVGAGIVTPLVNAVNGGAYSIIASGLSTPALEARNVMADIDIGGITYSVYGTLDSDDPGPPDPPGVMSADSYMNGRFDAATTWAAATSDTRKRLLVTAQRYLDTLPWKGTKTSPTQPLQWPRTGVTLSDGTAVDSAVYPTPIVYAEYDLAYAILVNPKLLTNEQGGKGNIKRVKAGSAEVEFFGSTEQQILPQNILVGIIDYLQSTGLSTSVAIVYGAQQESIFDGFREYDIEGVL